MPRRIDSHEGCSNASSDAPASYAAWARQLSAVSSPVSRRRLLQLVGATAALASASACNQQPEERLIAYSERPPGVIPGNASHYATSMVIDGFARGLLVTSHEGRPTKVEGNPEHPASLGGTGVFEQASVLSLYDPLRLDSTLHRGAPTTWRAALAARPRGKNAKPWLVMSPVSSPLIASLLDRFRETFPRSRICFHSPLARHSVYRASRTLFGRSLEPQYHFDKAAVVVSLGADFLVQMPNSPRFARDFARRRSPESAADQMSRLYVAETTWSSTGSLADHRASVRPTQLLRLAAALLKELTGLIPTQAVPEAILSKLPSPDTTDAPEWVRRAARDIHRARGSALVVPGDQLPVEVHLLVHAINQLGRAFGGTVTWKPPALIDVEGDSLEHLVQAVQADEVDSVSILDANPVYTAPASLKLGHWLRRVKHTLCLNQFENESSRSCEWVVPASHYLESWGDARSYDTTLSFQQPLIQPFYASLSSAEVIAGLSGMKHASGQGLLREFYRRQLGTDFAREWPARLQRGFANDSQLPSVSPEPNWSEASAQLVAALEASPARSPELNFEPSPKVFDGRFANNAWLLELPHPITKQSWGNALLIAPELADQLGISDNQVVAVEYQGHRVKAPALVVPGHADHAVTLALGYGQRTSAIADGVGFNAYLLRHPQSFGPRVTLTPTKQMEPIARTQQHSDARDRELAPILEGAEDDQPPARLAQLRGSPPSLLPVLRESGDQWAMTIDTTLCSGCNACVIACQAENNVPVVGKRGVLHSREMHWLRIDTYLSRAGSQTRLVHQPMLCQHCEHAPCEYVCPVNATIHSPDGLNEMVYNRCIGTRFCSNNCPYKVRRFNWFEYNTEQPTLFDLQKNPDVTVRERGVMEKCSYCVQRIRGAEHRALVEKRRLRAGEVVTACQAACPTRAIQFGSLRHRDTDMVRWRELPRAYDVLHELGTRPRTKYLAKVFNSKGALEG